MKAQKNLTITVRKLVRLWENLDHFKKEKKGLIDLNLLLELAEKCLILIGQCHSRGRQRVLTVLFKDRNKVKPVLKF